MTGYFDMNSKRVILEKVKTSKGTIQLQKRKGHYEIVFNGIFLMASYNGPSEEEMVKKALELLKHIKNINVLIAGLGVGYSLKAALEYENIGSIDIVEIEESIIRWNKTYFGEINEYALKNSKVKVFNCDFIEYIAKCSKSYSLIAIDIDNGPDWVVLDSNRRLYKRKSLVRMREMLYPGGILSIWSATNNNDLKQSLKEIFSYVELINSSDGNYIYFARN